LSVLDGSPSSVVGCSFLFLLRLRLRFFLSRFICLNSWRRGYFGMPSESV
jgi:hypothetical protein